MYQSYEEDLQRIINSLQKRVGSANNLSTDSSISSINESNKEVEEAEKCVVTI